MHKSNRNGMTSLTYYVYEQGIIPNMCLQCEARVEDSSFFFDANVIKYPGIPTNIWKCEDVFCQKSMKWSCLCSLTNVWNDNAT